MANDDKAQREIRRIAYGLWAQEGQPEGRDREHWEAAKEIWSFRNRDAADSEPGSASAVESQGISDRLKTTRPSTGRA